MSQSIIGHSIQIAVDKQQRANTQNVLATVLSLFIFIIREERTKGV
jgi:hypothetical protein